MAVEICERFFSYPLDPELMTEEEKELDEQYWKFKAEFYEEIKTHLDFDHRMKYEKWKLDNSTWLLEHNHIEEKLKARKALKMGVSKEIVEDLFQVDVEKLLSEPFSWY